MQGVEVRKAALKGIYLDFLPSAFIKEDRYLLGVSEAEIDGSKIKIYDRERTNCDILLYRNQIDSEVFNTAIQRYVNDAKRSAARLMLYAKKLHVEKKVYEVLGIWL